MAYTSFFLKRAEILRILGKKKYLTHELRARACHLLPSNVYSLQISLVDSIDLNITNEFVVFYILIEYSFYNVKHVI